MSSEDKRGMPVQSLMDAIGKGDDSDIVNTINKLITRGDDDKDLPLITKVEYPFELSVLDAYADYLKVKGYVKTSRNLKLILLWYRLNKCSEGGWRATQIEGILKAYASRVAEDDEFTRTQRLGVRRV